MRTAAPKAASAATASASPVISTVQLYPNPAADRATLRFDKIAVGTVSAYLTDMLGRRVLTIMQQEPLTAGAQSKTFATSGRPAGLYQCIVETAGGSRTSSRLSIVR